MAFLWGAMFVLGTVALTLREGGDAAVEAMLAGAQEAVTLSLSLAGAYLLWMGLMGVARQAGLMEALSRRLRRVCSWLFPDTGAATAPLTLNLAANLLGLGNAATPFGLEAMRLMQEENPCKDTATDAMCAFLAINASALQLIPTTLISLRAAAGSLRPAAIVIPSFLASAAATAAAVIACLLCRRGRKKSPATRL